MRPFNQSNLNDFYSSIKKISKKINIDDIDSKKVEKFISKYTPINDEINSKLSDHDGVIYFWKIENGIDVEIQEDIGDNEYMLSFRLPFSSAQSVSTTSLVLSTLYKHSHLVKEKNIKKQIDDLFNVLLEK